MTPTEISRRIKAARMLRGIEQDELDHKLEQLGLGKNAAARLERGMLPATPARRWALAGALGVPEEWFTAERVDEIVYRDAMPPADLLSQCRQEIRDLRGAVEDLLAFAQERAHLEDERWRGLGGSGAS